MSVESWKEDHFYLYNNRKAGKTKFMTFLITIKELRSQDNQNLVRDRCLQKNIM